MGKSRKRWMVLLWLTCFIIWKTAIVMFADTTDDSKGEAGAPVVFAQAAVLMDGDSGRILYGKNEDQALPMASTTKIMTCIVALEHADPEELVTVSEYAASMPDVQLNIRAGERYRLLDLLYSLMLESHNDSAVAIAEHVAGSLEAFAKIMNQKARDLGCSDTYFITPNGLDATDGENGKSHQTTAAELAKIMRYCALLSPKREEFLMITRAPSHAFSDCDRTRSFSCVNHNALLTSMDGALTGKTGFTSKAGYCYVGTVKRGDKTFVCALLACGWPPHKTYKWQDMRKLIEYGDSRYDYYEMPIETMDFKEIPVENGTKTQVVVQMAEGADEKKEKCRILMSEGETVTVRKKVRRQLKAPVPAGMGVGLVEYCIGEHVIKGIPVITAEEAEEWNPGFCLKTLLNHFLFCYNADEQYC